MNKNRLEAFSDGVIAIIITIMVLEFKVPHGAQWVDLLPLWPVFLSYVLSFVYVGIYWNNHHHLLHAAKQVNGAMLWANLNLLFWLSLMPFTTAWMGENHFAAAPVALYAADLLLCAIAYNLLQARVVKSLGPDSPLHQALGKDLKGKASIACYLAAVPLAMLGLPWLAGMVLAAMALIWLIPDRRIEQRLLAGQPR
ncbi:TMEM175 family protein [Rhodoferax sp. BLA1]|uniref:TMEM175 family protein n=1 Tax=Rhodoferax sp. BLA1 TaxID=2576062 RepID=UPI0015D1968C|nr:TMEM175 family protein [Rhodoferax sp. BLA1]